MAVAATVSNEGSRKVADWYDAMDFKEEGFVDHIHHGFYEAGETAHMSANQAAQVRMIEEALNFAGISDDPLKKPKNIIDVGCGNGGATRHLAKKYGSKCWGINLSPVQIRRAQELSVVAGMEDETSFILGDALDQPFPDGQFDLVWVMDMIDHVPHKSKAKVFSELARIAAPGATIIITTCCMRELSPGEESLTPDEEKLVNKICNACHLSLWCSPSDFAKMAESLALEDFKMADWTEHVVPYCRALTEANPTWRSLITGLLRGWSNFKLALARPRVLEAYSKGAIKYTVMACRKPQ